MGISRCVVLFLTLIFLHFPLFGQDTLQINREQAETIFLKENLLLLAEKLQINQAEAMVIQAGLWPNPTLSIDDVNLWSTKGQREILAEELPWSRENAFGKNQQFSVSLEQLIQTAGKRKKLIALEEVSVEKSKQYFKDLLRTLKLEFRNLLTELQYLQLKSAVYENQIHSVKRLTQSYRKQVDDGHIAKGEYIRLKALELELLQSVKELKNEKNKVEKELKLLMHLPAAINLKITPEKYSKVVSDSLKIENLLETALESRPDYKLAGMEESFYQNLYKFERAQAVPDLNFKVGYDRGGGVYYDFVGFGLSMDLPFFNRNQGNIKSAKIGIEHSKILLQQKELDLENEIFLAYQNLNAAIEFLSQIEPDYESTLDTLLENYTKNFRSRNMSLLEYLDFLEAYLENKEIILEAGKEVNERAEELNYAVGTDVIN
ncbi:TolC family protein [Aequorivita sp. H23M31]|uniref:TolC family protein n=1 Tax=Aequorivita ciconiae TaxID=2494375 RepID=A0A410G6R2_9FLAO|nr:TolC family protein [Aequorivita sp. H23M31]QAA82974.1 TolC family protein [Aequorivita sp. H23M31]